jgi:hypothetical protein
VVCQYRSFVAVFYWHFVTKRAWSWKWEAVTSVLQKTQVFWQVRLCHLGYSSRLCEGHCSLDYLTEEDYDPRKLREMQIRQSVTSQKT